MKLSDVGATPRKSERVFYQTYVSFFAGFLCRFIPL